MRKVIVTLAAIWLFAGLLVGCLSAAEFQKLPLERPATTLATSEDGSLLLVAHEEADLVTAWDVKTVQKVAEARCESPRFILCRGGKLFVANCGKSTISVIDPAHEWQIVDMVDSGALDVCYLSAPGGEFFQGHIVATGEAVQPQKYLSILRGSVDGCEWAC